MSIKSEKLRLLGEVGLFSGCTRRELNTLANVITEIHVPAGTHVTREGRPGKEFFVLAEGEAKVTVGGRTIATLTAGDFFGEMSILDPGPRSATVTAVTNLRLYVLTEASFLGLMDQQLGFARNIVRALVRRIRTMDMTEAERGREMLTPIS